MEQAIIKMSKNDNISILANYQGEVIRDIIPYNEDDDMNINHFVIVLETGALIVTSEAYADDSSSVKVEDIDAAQALTMLQRSKAEHVLKYLKQYAKEHSNDKEAISGTVNANVGQFLEEVGFGELGKLLKDSTWYG